MSERRDGDRVVVTGYSAGSHFPRTQAETQQRFEANGLSPEGPFYIDGSVYGRDLRLRGPGTVAGPVLGRGDVTLDHDGKGVQRLLGGVHANGNLVALSRGAGLRRSLVAAVDAAKYVVRGDAGGEHVSLQNAVVLGNVHGGQIQLVHCIIFGQVLAKEAVVVTASTLLGYGAPRVTFLGPCAVLFASGVSDARPELGPWRDGDGQSWEPDVRLHPVLRAAGYGALTNRPWEIEGAAGRLCPADWVRIDAERPVRKIRDGRMVESIEPVERYVLSIAGRVLNLRPIAEQIEHVSWMLRTALELDHYHPNTQQEIRRRWAERCTADERQVLELATQLEAGGPAPLAAAGSKA
ncbi:MAG: hypothetical protein HY744_03050 [Deltaproteobacteria bacterium]|nr:hypothetical protein [Deltaproteobacteria bacterium]